MYFGIRLAAKYMIFQQTKKQKTIFRQSDNHLVIYSILTSRGINIRPEQKNAMTQSKKHESMESIKVIIMDNSAYWIKNNAFYTAEVDEFGTVDKDTTRVVDTMGMDDVQLDQMLFIIDRLKEETFNDRGGSGN
jgi:hypothetical protein